MNWNVQSSAKKTLYYIWCFSKELVVNNPPAKAGDRNGFDPWVRKISWKRTWQPNSSILAWRIPRTEEEDCLWICSASFHGPGESKGLLNTAYIQPYTQTHNLDLTSSSPWAPTMKSRAYTWRHRMNEDIRPKWWAAWCLNGKIGFYPRSKLQPLKVYEQWNHMI